MLNQSDRDNSNNTPIKPASCAGFIVLNTFIHAVSRDILEPMKSTYWYVLLGIAVIVVLIFVRNNSESSTAAAVTPYDGFAQCIADAGAKFYGAYWCPHCQDQKKLFKNSKKLPYVECSTANQQAQTQVCIDAKVTGYPTWDFADGTRMDGQQTLEALAEKTNCVLPTL